MRTTLLAPALASIVAFATLGACSTAPKHRVDRRSLQRQAENVAEDFRDTDPGMRSFFEDSYAYAVFPNVGKGGLLVGGSYGRGVVYQLGEFVGYADMTQGSLGLQAGGEGFSEIIFFESRPVFREFTDGKFTVGTQASAVAVDSGASAKATYINGVAVFIRGESGLMVEASVAGQSFSYQSRYAFAGDE